MDQLLDVLRGQADQAWRSGEESRDRRLDRGNWYHGPTHRRAHAGYSHRDRQEDRESDQGSGFQEGADSIQGDEVRITAPSRDELQTVIAFLRSQDFGIELKFGNYRG